MSRVRPNAVAMVLVLLSAGGACAFNPNTTDILTFRLGMAPQEVERILDGQGISAPRRVEHFEACPGGSPATRCLASITAKTHDGTLVFAFSPPSGSDAQAVTRIDYTFNGHGAGEPAMIRAAVMDRFGPPDAPRDLAWCERPTDDGACPGDRPSLTYRPGSGVTSILSLTAGTTK